MLMFKLIKNKYVVLNFIWYNMSIFLVLDYPSFKSWVHHCFTTDCVYFCNVLSHRPKINDHRLSDDISKPKVYTNDTVHYRLIFSNGEPRHLEEALGATNWKSVIDVEYDALYKIR